MVNDPEYLNREREESRKIAEKLNTVPPTGYSTYSGIGGGIGSSSSFRSSTPPRDRYGDRYSDRGSVTSGGYGGSYGDSGRRGSYGGGGYGSGGLGSTMFPSQSESEDLINQFSRVTGCGYFEVGRGFSCFGFSF